MQRAGRGSACTWDQIHKTESRVGNLNFMRKSQKFQHSSLQRKFKLKRLHQKCMKVHDKL